jgi:phage major head subunit gpT-like protein
MPLTPQFIMDLESNMRVVQENDYAALAANLFWSDIAKVIPSRSKREIIHWLLSTAYLDDEGYGENLAYDEIESTYTELTNKVAGRGLEIDKSELEDLDGNGVEVAAKWSSDMGQAFAYWPQQQVSYLMNNGQTAAVATGYDKVALFTTNHPVNPVDTSAGLTYSNYFHTGNALPIDNSVTVEEALVNLSTLYANMAAIPQPNGKYPRRLRPYKIFVPPALAPRAAMLTQATIIAMAAGSLGAQGGSGDVSDLVKLMAYGAPVVCDELGAAFGGSNTTYYVLFAPLGAPKSTLGPMIYVQREPFSITYHGPMTTAELARKRKFQWTANGRNVTGPGHPYLIAKCLSSTP